MVKSKINELFSTRRWLKVVAIVLASISMLILGHLLYQKYLDHQDSQRFIAVEEDVVQLTGKLNEVDKDINWRLNSTCNHIYQGWFVVGVHCGVASEVSVSFDSGYTVDRLMEMFNPIFADQDNFLLDPDDGYTSPNFPDKYNPGYSSQVFWSQRGDMKCRLYYAIEDPIGESLAREIEMSFVCNERAREAWFPLE